ncbi:siderophore-interacting protein [Pseudoclavibacter chungangensis]|uniref:Siderophore-interacting protein n=1 Tax=Pseudoclavibacter chungangensis TaxID=587635 RepID=A0A7J5BQ75_9MICO|nr:siderophore-interacting protein [Pseudoclavibacter chungangensis]KAB1655950.1 siderophore-interacting protein [Pseudoclavibacter chungangensis]NYJ66394.1 NADPH-dependent ferric siderophore reductase [Pseudoclavibacter chungangensis]
MPNITVTHSDSGLVLTNVVRSERVSPHIVRVTFAGGDLDRFEYKGFDQWFRLAIPVHAEDRFDNLPSKFGFGGLLKFLTLPKGTRPVIRNYTIRQFDAASRELDVDFVVHGTEGIAGPWATTVEAGAPVALIDQGCGWAPVPAARSVIVADESAMPAALGILRDMPRDSVGDAIIELFDERDRQDVDAPAGVTVQWLVRDPADAPGSRALPALRELELGPDVYGFAVGESALATGARRHLVGERGVPKANVTFCGYWRVGRASPG